MPFSNPSIILLKSFVEVNLFKSSIFTGKCLNLLIAFSYCCLDKIVVGQRYATCLLFITVLNIALIATSVLPKPTSPQSNLSIGLELDKSFNISLIDFV